MELKKGFKDGISVVFKGFNLYMKDKDAFEDFLYSCRKEWIQKNLIFK